MYRWGSVVLLVIVLLGCSQTDGRSADLPATSSPTEATETAEEPAPRPDLAPIEPRDEQHATMYAERLLQAVKDRDADSLIRLLANEESAILYDEKLAGEILRGFEANFAIDTLVVKIFDEGHAMSPEAGQFEFLFEDGGPPRAYSEETALVVRFSDGGVVHFHNAYLRYFPFAAPMAETYLGLIRKADAQGLAAFLNADDLDVPIRVAEETIRRYEEMFDLDKAQTKYEGGFRFAIEDGSGMTHVFEIIYGDGLMGIRDEFIPAF